MSTLHKNVPDNISAMYWLLTEKLIIQPNCSKCKNFMHILKWKDSYRWKCYKCFKVNGIYMIVYLKIQKYHQDK